MCQSGEKLKKLHSFVILRGLKGIAGDFFENPLGTFLSPIHLLPNCQISDNSDAQILRYHVTNGRTNERDSLGLNQLIAERPKTSISWNFGPQWPIFDSFGQNGQNGSFSKKRLEHFCRAYKP